MSTTLAPSQKRQRSPEQKERDAKKKRDDRAEFKRLREAELRRQQEAQVINLVVESEEEEQEESEWDYSDDDMEEELVDDAAELESELAITRSKAQVGIDGDKEVIAFTTAEQEKRDIAASNLRIKELKVASDLRLQEIKTKGLVDLMLAIVHKQQSGDPIDERVLKLMNGENKFLLQ